MARNIKFRAISVDEKVWKKLNDIKINTGISISRLAADAIEAYIKKKFSK